MGLIGDVANAGMGLLLQGHNDRRQLRQHQKMGQQQLGLNLQQMQAGKDMDYDFWKKTNYGAQVDEMKKAGLGVGMMYGGSGAGGAMTGGAGGNVNTPDAPKGGGEIMGLQLMGAQKGLMEAQTEKAKAEADKTRGVDTELTGNQAKIAELERSLRSEGYEFMLDKLGAESVKLREEAANAKEGERAELLRKQGEVVAIGLANELKREGIKLTEAQTNAMLEGIKQKWAEVKVKEGQLELNKFINDVAASTRLTVETATKVVDMLAKGKMQHWKNQTELEKTVIKKQK